MPIPRSSFLTAVLIAGLILASLPALGQSTATPTSAAKPTQSISQKIAASKDLLDINTATAA